MDELLVTPINLARNEVISHSDLVELVATGPKKRVKRTVESVPVEGARPVEVVAEVAAPVVDTRTAWERANYSPTMLRLVGHFERLSENHVLPRNVRDIKEVCASATQVSDFDRFSESQLSDMIQTVRERLPRIEADIVNFIGNVSRARPMIVEADFI